MSNTHLDDFNPHAEYLSMLPLTSKLRQMFNPRNFYAGNPPFEIVLHYIDTEVKKDPDQYPYIPIYFSDAGEYQWVDVREINDVEYQDILSAERVRIFTQQTWPYQEDNDDDYHYEEPSTLQENHHYSDDEIAQINDGFEDYISSHEGIESTVDYNDVLEAMQQLKLNYGPDSNLCDILNLAANLFFSDQEHEDYSSKEFNDHLYESVGCHLVGNTNYSPKIKDPIIKSVTEKFEKSYPISNCIQFLNAHITSEKYARTIGSNYGMSKIMTMCHHSTVFDCVTPQEHNTSYFGDDADIKDLLNEIDKCEGSTCDYDGVFHHLLRNLDLYSFNLRDMYHVVHEYDAQFVDLVYVPSSPHVDPGSFCFREKMIKFLLSYLQVRSPNESVLKKMMGKGNSVGILLGLQPDEIGDYYRSFRKKYKYVFLKDDIVDVIMNFMKTTFYSLT